MQSRRSPTFARSQLPPMVAVPLATPRRLTSDRVWESSLPAPAVQVDDPSDVVIHVECGYEQFVLSVPPALWRRVEQGQMVIVQRSLPVASRFVRCEWHFNRYRYGNLFVDWDQGDLKFWIELDQATIRQNNETIAWHSRCPLAGGAVGIDEARSRRWMGFAKQCLGWFKKYIRT